MRTPDVSVAIVNYNSAAMLEGLLGSLREDTFSVEGREGRLEILVVDNASRAEDNALL
jgi:glycosyltransferase involved in cell wall biosynthesis